jgi:hypothetical protein
MWSGVGLVLCAVVIAFAVRAGRRESGSYYAREVYGMTARTHLAYALLSGAFGAAFAAAFAVRAIPAVPLLGVYALVFIFYFSSFARGFSDEE